ncbi:hypothetical protein [Acrocarpospora corrugata]|uniref:hypothetical protein n=1 Tax=Acrocarpospora corrugata TaxID=35763 RepID=UPI0031DF3605
MISNARISVRHHHRILWSGPSLPAGRAADLLALLQDTATEPRIDTQLEALTLAVAADLPVLLWGEPGSATRGPEAARRSP